MDTHIGTYGRESWLVGGGAAAAHRAPLPQGGEHQVPVHRLFPQQVRAHHRRFPPTASVPAATASTGR